MVAFFRFLPVLLIPWLACTSTHLIRLAVASITTYISKMPMCTLSMGNNLSRAVAINDGRFVFVGNQLAGFAYQCGAQQTKDMAGAFIYPQALPMAINTLKGLSLSTRTLSYLVTKVYKVTVLRLRSGQPMCLRMNGSLSRLYD